MNSFKMVDLFAGCGGLTEGFKLQGGFKTVGSVEWDKYASDTLINRLKEKWGYKNAEEIVLRYDIQNTVQLLDGYKSSEYGNSIGLKSIIKNAGGCDLVIGGPPCQAYSVAGRVRDENGMHNDYRNYLFESYLSTIKGIGSPPVILFENVPGMLSASPGGVSIIDRITEAFNRSGYIITQDIKQNALFNVADYGVPQNRKRVILIGLNKKTFGKNSVFHLDKIYESIHSMKKDIKATVSSALEGLDKFYPLTTEKKINGKRFSHEPVEGNFSNSIPRYHSRRDISIFKELATDIVKGTKKYSTTDALKDLYTRKTGKKSAIHKYNVLKKDSPSNTIPAHLYKDGLRHIHPDPDQSRTITVREAARIQSFSDDFAFYGPMGAQYKMIGNAVPPMFSKVLAKSIYSFLSSI